MKGVGARLSTNIFISSDNVNQSEKQRNVGGLPGLVTVLDQDTTGTGRRSSGTVMGACSSGSTPGTATAPLSARSSTQSSGVFALLLFGLS